MSARPRWFPVLMLSLLPSLLAAAAHAGNGDPVDGHPTYRERALLAVTNACRQGPQQYRAHYLPAARGILRPANYPAVAPLYWSLPLNRSARAHSLDMARTPCFQHDSCDGTDLWDRIRRYYRRGTSMGENIAMGFPSALAAVNGLVLDNGAADHSSGDGHRKNIMAAKFTELGNGAVVDGKRGPCDTQDFGNGPPEFATPLVSGSHLVDDEGTITFLASFHARNGKAPDQAAIELDGRVEPLDLGFGKKASGTYRLVVAQEDRCRPYRFRFKDGEGRTWFHPEGGTLFTTGEGGCKREYERGNDAVAVARIARGAEPTGTD